METLTVYLRLHPWLVFWPLFAVLSLTAVSIVQQARKGNTHFSKRNRS